MSTSPIPVDAQQARAQRVSTTDDALIVELADGRTLSVPLTWYPRLAHGTREERARWRLIGNGEGIHWPELDEDISVEGLLAYGAQVRRLPPYSDGSTHGNQNEHCY